MSEPDLFPHCNMSCMLFFAISICLFLYITFKWHCCVNRTQKTNKCIISVLISHSSPDASDAETSATLDESVWCGAHGVRYTDDFRSVVYKINPTHLSCVYKKMFEASATNSLLGIDTDDLDDGDKKSDFTKKMKDENNTWATLIRPQVPGSCVSLHSAQSKYKFDIPPPHRGQSQIIRSVSSAYTCTSASDKAITKKVKLSRNYYFLLKSTFIKLECCNASDIISSARSHIV